MSTVTRLSSFPISTPCSSPAAIQCFQSEAIASVCADRETRSRYRLKSIVGITSALKRAGRATPLIWKHWTGKARRPTTSHKANVPEAAGQRRRRHCSNARCRRHNAMQFTVLLRRHVQGTRYMNVIISSSVSFSSSIILSLTMKRCLVCVVDNNVRLNCFHCRASCRVALQ